MDDGFTQEDVDQYYGGDWNRYRADLKNGHRYAVSWSDMAAYNTVLTGLEEAAKEQIEKYLGYVPHPTIIVTHEVYIRSEIERFQSGAITKKVFEKNVQLHVRDIRNEDMKKDGWVDVLEFSDAYYEGYDTILAQYKDQARNRLAGYLGYYPELRFSLQAEIYLRELLAMDNFTTNWELTAMDCKALNVIRYREIYLTEGVVAADQSPLLFNQSAII